MKLIDCLWLEIKSRIEENVTISLPVGLFDKIVASIDMPTLIKIAVGKANIPVIEYNDLILYAYRVMRKDCEHEEIVYCSEKLSEDIDNETEHFMLLNDTSSDQLILLVYKMD